MSYDIHLFRRETKEKYDADNGEDFFENEQNLVKFSKEQWKELYDRLVIYGFFVESKSEFGTNFGFEEDDSVSALLGDTGLYFSASGEDGIFEISMTASEFTDTGEYCKFDPQNDEWGEDI